MTPGTQAIRDNRAASRGGGTSWVRSRLPFCAVGPASPGQRLRTALMLVQQFRDPRLRPWCRQPWKVLAGVAVRGYRVGCNICGWRGHAFSGEYHSESAVCPRCYSIARDRFLFHCWTSRTPYRRGDRVLETSPRLGERYRQEMMRLVRYVASDYDERAHKGNLHLDLQVIDLPDACLDVILSAHVLEHVPDTGRAMAEMHRVLAPGGLALLSMPVPHSRTARPTFDEYHGDTTKVHWRFGWDFADLARGAGFEVTTLVTQDLVRRAQKNDPWGYVGMDVDSDSVLGGARRILDELTVAADDATAAWLGLLPSFWFIGWHCRRRP